MIKLTEKHLRKLSIVTGLPLEKVCELDAMGLLNEERTIDLLMRHDWKLLKRAKSKIPVRYRIKAVTSFVSASDAPLYAEVRFETLPYRALKADEIPSASHIAVN